MCFPILFFQKPKCKLKQIIKIIPRVVLFTLDYSSKHHIVEFVRRELLEMLFCHFLLQMWLFIINLEVMFELNQVILYVKLQKQITIKFKQIYSFILQYYFK
jgi:hypothetical protein